MGIFACPTSARVLQTGQTCPTSLAHGTLTVHVGQSRDCLAVSGFRAVEAVESMRASDIIDFKGTVILFVDTLLLEFLSILMTLVHGFLCLCHGFLYKSLFLPCVCFTLG